MPTFQLMKDGLKQYVKSSAGDITKVEFHEDDATGDVWLKFKVDGHEYIAIAGSEWRDELPADADGIAKHLSGSNFYANIIGIDAEREIWRQSDDNSGRTHPRSQQKAPPIMRYVWEE